MFRMPWPGLAKLSVYKNETSKKWKYLQTFFHFFLQMFPRYVNYEIMS